MKKIDHRFLEWMSRQGFDEEVPKRFVCAMWRALDAGFIRMRDREVWLTRKGRKAGGKVER